MRGEMIDHGRDEPKVSQVRRREPSRGQVLVIFAMSAFIFVGLCAVVVDVAWYWASSLRVQRAADAAALAGVVLLPGQVNTGADNAYLRAFNEAQKNGYPVGGGVTVTPVQDSLATAGGNPNQLDVTISAPVPTFFMRVLGINSITATRTAKASFVLPVPMGSPQNYYGVGQFVSTDVTTRAPAAAVSGGNWKSTGNVAQNDNKYAVSGNANPSVQQWTAFGLTAAGGIPAGATIGTISVQLSALLASGASACPLFVDLSWDGGTSWTSATVSTPLTTTELSYSLPATGVWGPHTWVQGDFTDAKFRVRLTWDTPACNSGRNAQVDAMTVSVASETIGSVADPVSGSALVPQNFWGAMFTKGGVRQNGDYFGPATIGSSASGNYTYTDASPTYDAGGYDYTVDLTGASNGQVRLFDPVFCATGPNTTSGWYGAGDHWTNRGIGGASVAIAPVAVTYRLYRDVNNTPYNTADDTLISTLAYDPMGKTLGDFSGSMGDASTLQNFGRADAQDCANSTGHNQWVTLASGLAGGIYRVNVDTSSQTVNANVGAENLFSIWAAGSGGRARVYGAGRMAGYTQVGAAPQAFYLAQIGQVHAGKTLQIQLFDPGDVSGNATLSIQSPDGSVYNNVTFSYVADAACQAGRSDSCSGTNRTTIQTAVNGSSSFDNSLITITIVLPNMYGSTGLTPAGVPGATAADKAGWWKVYYNVTNANDTTTWMVNIVGNPVHLIVP